MAKLLALLMTLHALHAQADTLRAIADLKQTPGAPPAGRLAFGAPPPNSETGHYSVATLDADGLVVATSPPLVFADDAMMPGCNAGVDRAAGRYYKTTSRTVTMVPASGCECKPGSICCRDPTVKYDTGACFGVSDCSAIPVGSGDGGQLLTIEAATGNITHNVSLSQPQHPPFGTFRPSDGKLYSMVPYSYTQFGLFRMDPRDGKVEQLATYPKAQLDGIAICEGLILRDEYLVYQFGGRADTLRVLSLTSQEQVNSVPGFYGPLVVDPLAPSRLLAAQNVQHRGFVIVSLDPLSNSSHTVMAVTNTSLGADLRLQDQASMAVDKNGTTVLRTRQEGAGRELSSGQVWLIGSYNDPDTGLLLRGMFKLNLAKDRGSGELVSEREAFSEKDGKPWLGRLDYF